MKILTVIPEMLKTAGRVLFNGLVTGTGDQKCVLPSGTNGLYIVCNVTMGNAADLTINVITADDADGANQAAITENIPIYENDVRQTDAKAHTITESSGAFVVVFCIPPILIPTGKYVGIDIDDSNDANIVSAQVFDDVYHQGEGA